MKKFIFLLLNITLVLILLIGCTKDTNSTNIGENDSLNQDVKNDTKDNDSAINGTGKDSSNEKDIDEPVLSFKDELKKQGLKTSPYRDGWELTRLDWIKKYLEHTYKDIGIKDVKASIISNHEKNISPYLDLRVENAFIQFSSDKKPQDIEANDEGNYAYQVCMIYASKRESDETYFYFLDVIKNEEYDDDILKILEYGLSLLGHITDYIPKSEKDGIIPSNVSIFETNNLPDGYRINSIYGENNKLILLLTKPVKINGYNSLVNDVKLCSYDHNTKEMTEIFKAENIEASYFSYHIGEGLAYGSYSDNYLMDFDGKVTTIAYGEIKYIYSPDKKHYAFTDGDRNLIIKNTESEEAIITLEKVSDENLKLSRRYSYGTYAWLDNENFMYTMTGWEWSSGFGIVNINTLENTVLENSFLKIIHKIDGKRLITYYCPTYEVYPFTFGHYDLDKKPYVYHEDFNAEKYPDVYQNTVNLSYIKLLSSNFSHLYTFEENQSDGEFLIKEFSIAEGKLEKEIKIVPSKYLPFKQINDAVLIEDKFIIIYDTNNLYFIDLRDN